MCRFGGGFTSWTQPFRLKHLSTGRYLAVKARTEVCEDPPGVGVYVGGAASKSGVGGATSKSGVGGATSRSGVGGRRDGEGVRRGSAECRRRWTVCLVEPCKADKDITAFCFTKATVS